MPSQKKNKQPGQHREGRNRSAPATSRGPREAGRNRIVPDPGHRSGKRHLEKRPPKSDQVPESRGSRVLVPHVAERESEPLDDSGQMRLQKFLAMAGVDSRRNCEDYIRTGRVTVDSEVVNDPARSVGSKTQDIRLDGERLRLPRFRYFLVNKPKGVLCTNSDPQGRPRAVDLVPVTNQRMFTVGRLDENTEGMLLITNDGDLAQRLAHPRFEVIRKYRCLVAGIPAPEILKQLREGMYFAEGFFKFRSVRVFSRQGRSTVLELELQEGKNREIRRLMARVGHKVLTLERVAFGPLTLGSLAPGRHRELAPYELNDLRHFIEHGETPERTSSRHTGDGKGFGYRTGKTRGSRRRGAAEVRDQSNQAAASIRRPSASGKSAVRKPASRKPVARKPANAKPAAGKPAQRPSTATVGRAINKGRDRRKHR